MSRATGAGRRGSQDVNDAGRLRGDAPGRRRPSTVGRMLRALRMISSSQLSANSIARSFRFLLVATLNKLHQVFRTGNMKYAFERMYLENRDPWNYQYSAYERDKYECTLSCALTWRKASVSALEIGCSIGIFSGMLAGHFTKVTAMDISGEAIRVAVSHNRHLPNIEFLQGDIRALALEDRYNVIFCAEVFYYLGERDAQLVCRQLARHLAPGGVIIFVAGAAGHNPTPFCWRAVLATTFHQDSIQLVDDPMRPYEIVVFSRPASA
ncbi:Nodulation protein S (NodS) [Rhizobiales bacterium GAS191]|nr:Nodulation protein S (NodS) [Rhizobiales bacterium GAS191]